MNPSSSGSHEEDGSPLRPAEHDNMTKQGTTKQTMKATKAEFDSRSLLKSSETGGRISTPAGERLLSLHGADSAKNNKLCCQGCILRR